MNSKQQAIRFVDDLDLSQLFESLEILTTDFSYKDVLDVEDTDGCMYAMEVNVYASYEYNEEDNSYNVISKKAMVDFGSTYYTTDSNGVEKLRDIDFIDLFYVEREIEKRIINYLY